MLQKYLCCYKVQLLVNKQCESLHDNHNRADSGLRTFFKCFSRNRNFPIQYTDIISVHTIQRIREIFN